MKKSLNVIVLAAVIFSLNLLNISASSKNINANACETVYTNYYFFLEAIDRDYLDVNNLASHYTKNKATYHNNYYQVNFDNNNIGYGSVRVTTTTNTNGLKSMSLDDYYNIYIKASKNNGAYTEGNVNYIVAHDWYKATDYNNWIAGETGLNLQNKTVSALKNATINAETTVTQRSQIDYYQENPFTLEIERSYYGYTTGSAIYAGRDYWYLQPAVYYIQYCEATPQYTIEYRANANDVVNLPTSVTVDSSEDTTISTLIPYRQGYNFLGWSTNPSLTYADSTYNGGTLYTQRQNLVLYAIWERTDAYLPENPKTGVIDYLLPFGGVATASLGGLSILKRKKSYKQF